MNLGAVLAGVPLKTPIPAELAGRQITALEYDSRRIIEGALFFAFPGAKADGRSFARHAMEHSAAAAVSELPPPDDFDGPWIQVEHGRRALSLACRNFYGPLDEKLTLIGITGTNGKTTTAFLMDCILRAAGKITALVGTIEYRLGPEILPAINTTPESVDLYRMLDKLLRMGGTHATMEVSSHALALARVYGVHFQAAVFTNFTRDHLDFHLTMESYFSAKNLLFQGSGAAPPSASILNADDAEVMKIQPAPGTHTFTYGIDAPARVRATAIDSGFHGLKFTIEADGRAIAIDSPLVGRINVYNILAACSAALALGIDPEAIARGVHECQTIPGRFERVDEGQSFLVVVDYAHTDDALRNTIAVARALAPKRIITLFGCGGDRDRTKRPLMGKAAAELSDFVVLTSDNPRSEDPLAILNDALVGVRRTDTPHVVEVDREKAIRRAIGEARAGDIVILAGKGHETYQVLKNQTIAFDDREVTRRVLRGFGYGKR